MEDAHKKILMNTLDLIEDSMAALDNEIRRDSRALGVVKGLVFDPEKSDSASLVYEMTAQGHIERRIEFFKAERETWSKLSDTLYDELYRKPEADADGS